MFAGSASRELQLKRLPIVPLDVVGHVSAQACHRCKVQSFKCGTLLAQHVTTILQLIES